MRMNCLSCLARPSVRFFSAFYGFITRRQNRAIYSLYLSIARYVKQTCQCDRSGEPNSKNEKWNEERIRRMNAIPCLDHRAYADHQYNQTKYPIENADQKTENTRFVCLKNVAAMDTVHRGTGNLTRTVGAYKKSQFNLQNPDQWLSFKWFPSSRNEVSKQCRGAA